MSSNEIGIWTEYWTVGGSPADPYPLEFEVVAAPPPPPPPDACQGAFSNGDVTLTSYDGWYSSIGGTGTSTANLTQGGQNCSMYTTASSSGDYLQTSSYASGTTATFQLWDSGCVPMSGAYRSCQAFGVNYAAYPIYDAAYLMAEWYDSYYNTLWVAQSSAALWVYLQ